MLNQILCPTHGENSACVICHHLRSNSGLGYHVIAADDEFYETALCDKCQALLLEEQAWSDQLWNFAGLKLYCRQCFESALEGHQRLSIGQFAPGEDNHPHSQGDALG
jgi:hypothetical protein